MNVKTSILLFALLMLAAGATALFAGTTGKISGRITDASTGEPLIAANVLLKGTRMGTSSDVDGNFMILNIPPGTYTVTVTMIGYRQVQYENVRVNIDLTTRLLTELHPMAVELEAVIVTAERKLIVKDMTGSLSTTTADQIESLPVQNLQQVLRLNAGIIESDGRLHMRGGRPGEIAYWVDGISSTDVYDGRMGTTVENSAIQEVQVVSGTFNAEYGQAMSGIVNIITKEGGSNYTGQLKIYGGDYLSNDDRFGLYQSLQTVSDSTVKGLTRIVSSTRDHPLKNFNPIYNGEFPIYNGEFSLSGPVPFTGDNLTFFANGRYIYDKGYFYGRNWFRPNGTPGDSSLVAMNPNKAISLQGKLNFQPISSLKTNFSIFWNKNDRDRNYFRYNTADYQFNVSGVGGYNQFNTHDYKYDPYGLPQYHSTGLTLMFTLNQILSQSTFYEVHISRFYSESKQYVWDDPNTANTYLVSIIADSTKGIFPAVFDPYTSQGKARLDSITGLGGRYEYIPDPSGSGRIYQSGVDQRTGLL